MNTGKLRPKITLPGAICSICNTPFDKCDMKKHLQSFLVGYGHVIRAKKNKEIAWKNRKGPEKKSNRLSHNKLIREFRIKEKDLPPVLKLLILNLEIEKAEGKHPSEASDVISMHLKRFHAKESNFESPGYLNAILVGAGRKLFDISVNPNTQPSLLRALARPYGPIYRAKGLAAYITESPVEASEYSHCIDLSEKSALERLRAIEEVREPEQKEPFVSPAEEKIKRQYVALLDKNIIPIAEFVRKEREKMLESIQSFLKLNTTSVFTYTYDEETKELTGRIADIATKIIQFKH